VPPKKPRLVRPPLTDWQKSLPDIIPERLRRAVELDDNGCWAWTLTLDIDGYGRTSWRGKQRGAHRVFYTIFNDDPDDLVVDHTCHNTDPTCPGGRRCRHRRCTNPAHLEAVTWTVNFERGKHGQARHIARQTPFWMIGRTYLLRGEPVVVQEAKLNGQCYTVLIELADGTQVRRLFNGLRLPRQAVPTQNPKIPSAHPATSGGAA
jgi:hypothetical protein